MIDARTLGRNQHIQAKFDTDVGSLELVLDHTTSDVYLTPDEVYDLFAWLYNCHRDMLAFQMLRASINMAGACLPCSPSEPGVASDQSSSVGRWASQGEWEQPGVAPCLLCQQEQHTVCELCKKPLCLTHRREVNGYFSLRRYIMCDVCVQRYLQFVGSHR